MTYLILILFAFLFESRPEATIYTGKYQGYGPRVFGKFRVNYHLPLFFRWMATCIAVTVICEWSTHWTVIVQGASLFPAYAIVEDIGYWLFKREWPTADSWIGKMFGGFTIWDTFYPNAWWMGLTASYALYWILR